MGVLAISDLRPVDGEPRVHDLRLAAELGFTRPSSVRVLIRRNAAELAAHGLVHQIAAPIRSGKGRVQIANEYWLNEPQALLVCMFARTERAAEVRRQVIGVFMAWRRGELQAQPSVQDRWTAYHGRIEALRSAAALLREAERPQLALLVAQAPIWRRPGWRRLQKFFSDIEVRDLAVASHRQMTLDEAVACITERFGPSRAPSRSALHRFWQRLDGLYNAGAN